MFASKRTIGNMGMFIPSIDSKGDINPEYVVETPKKTKLNKNQKKKKNARIAKASKMYNLKRS